MWYVAKDGKPDPLYTSVKEPKARMYFQGAVKRGRSAETFYLLHDNKLIEEQKGGVAPLNPNVQVTHIPPIYKPYKP